MAIKAYAAESEQRSRQAEINKGKLATNNVANGRIWKPQPLMRQLADELEFFDKQTEATKEGLGSTAPPNVPNRQLDHGRLLWRPFAVSQSD